MTTPYAYTRRTDPATGGFAYAGASTTFEASSSPALELVVRLLRTPLGSCQADPTWGVDWSRVDRMRASVEADAKAAITAGLSPLVRDGSIASLAVAVQAHQGGVLAYQVDFTDPRTQTRQSTTGDVP